MSTVWLQVLETAPLPLNYVHCIHKRDAFRCSLSLSAKRCSVSLVGNILEHLMQTVNAVHYIFPLIDVTQSVVQKGNIWRTADQRGHMSQVQRRDQSHLKVPGGRDDLFTSF